MAQYIEDAKALYRHAQRELGEWRLSQDDHTLLRDAAEKTWGAVSEAANELLFAHDRVSPSGTGARSYGLKSVERRNRQVRRLDMSGRFGRFQDVLHKACFYEGDCPLPLVTQYIAEAQDFINDAESLSDDARQSR